MFNSLIVACALIGAPAVVFADTTEEVTSEVVTEEVTSEDEVFEITSEIVEDDFDIGDWVSETFNTTTITMLLSVAANIILVFKMFSNAKNVITDNVFSLKKVDAHTDSAVSTSVSTNVESKIKPLFDATLKINTNVINACELTCKMVAAAQDTSVAGKKYFAELTQSMGEVFNSSKKFASEITEKLNEQIELTEKETAETTAKLDAIVEGKDDGTQI